MKLSLEEVDRGWHGVEWLMNSLSLDKHEWMEDIKRGESSFLACIESTERVGNFKKVWEEVFAWGWRCRN